jgi:hypothetical protein
MATIATLSVLLEAKGQRQFLGTMGKVAAALVGATVAMGKLSERGGQFLTVQNAFTRLTGRQTDALAQLRLATQGLIADYQLMEQANLSLALGSSRNVDQFAQLAETAQLLGRALGLDTAFALNSLNIGIARQSRLVLDNIGIIVDTTLANRRYADAIGRTVGALSDAERQEAFRIEALRQAGQKTEELGEVTLNAGDAYRQFVVEIRNTTDALSTGAASSGIVGMAYLSLAEIMRGLRGEYRQAGELAQQFEDARLAYFERLAQFRGVSTFAAETEAARAQMLAQLELAAAFNASLVPVREFNTEMDLLESQLLAIGPLAEPAINPLTGQLFDLGVPTQLLSHQFLPDLSEEILNTANTFLILLAAAEQANAEMNKMVDVAANAQRGLGVLGGVGRFLGISIPFLGQAGGLVSAFSAFSGFFAEGGSIPSGGWGVVGERGPEVVQGPARVTPMGGGEGGLTINVPPARDPITFARDQQWARAIAETFRHLESGGFRAAAT